MSEYEIVINEKIDVDKSFLIIGINMKLQLLANNFSTYADTVKSERK